MKKNYMILYYVSSIMSFIPLVVFLILQFVLRNKDNYYSTFTKFFEVYYLLDIILIISFLLLVVIMFLNKYKIEYKFDCLTLPISYLVFYVIMVILSIINNYYVVINFMHFVYYYGFIIFAYLLLSIYTLLGFNLKKIKKNIK